MLSLAKVSVLCLFTTLLFTLSTENNVNSIHLNDIIRSSTDRGSFLPGPASTPGALYPPRNDNAPSSRSSSRTGWFSKLLNRGGGRAEGKDEEYQRLRADEDDTGGGEVGRRSKDGGFEIGEDEETSDVEADEYEMLDRDGHSR